VPRVKRGTKRRASRKKTLTLAKGFFPYQEQAASRRPGSRREILRYGYVGRRLKKARFPCSVDRTDRRRLPCSRPFLQPLHERFEEMRDRPQS